MQHTVLDIIIISTRSVFIIKVGLKNHGCAK